MRVIAGTARGIPLCTIEEQTTRPTIDRVKESMFNIIAPYLAEAEVLDCFSGSGALCIEALSRGASRACFIEKNPKAIECITQNLKKTRLSDKATILKGSFENGLERLATSSVQFDIIFLDPPHRSGFSLKAMEIISNLQLLKKHGIIVTEHHSDEIYPDSYAGMIKYRDAKYGNTTLSFYEEEL